MGLRHPIIGIVPPLPLILSEYRKLNDIYLIFAFDQIKKRLVAENIRISDTKTRPRSDKTLFDIDCVTEAVINALVHNDWSLSQPLISLFADRLEILSHGGLPKGETEDMFFQGISRPRNDMLMRIFLNMDLTEHTGHGIPSIVSKYGREVFHIAENYINVVIPFDAEVLRQTRNNVGINVGISKIQKQVLGLLLEDGAQSIAAMAKRLDVSTRTVERALAALQEKNLIVRSGSRKSGRWIVTRGE